MYPIHLDARHVVERLDDDARVRVGPTSVFATPCAEAGPKRRNPVEVRVGRHTQINSMIFFSKQK